MPDILLKNEIGTPVPYYDINTITVPRCEGGTATYTFGVPDATPTWDQMQSLLSNGTYTKYTITIGDRKLVSTNYPRFGLWLVTNYDAVKLMDGESWQYFRTVNGGALFSNSSSAYSGLYFYNDTDMTVSKIYETGYGYSTYKTVDGGWLVTGSATGLFYYDNENGLFTQIYDKSTSWTQFITMPDGLLISNTSGANGILHYKDADHTATQIYANGYYWLYSRKIGDVYLISSATSSSSGYGILMYDPETDEVTKLYDKGYTWNYYQELEGGLLLSSSTSGTGLVWFDSAERTITQVSTYSYRWQYFAIIDSGCVCSTTVSSTSGLLYFRLSDKTTRQIYTTGYYYNYYASCGDSCVFSTSQNSSYGLIYFNGANETATQLFNTGCWNTLKPVKDGFLCCCSSSNTGVKYISGESVRISLFSKASRSSVNSPKPTASPFVTARRTVNSNTHLPTTEKSMRNSKFKGESKCATPHLDTNTLQQKFLIAYNLLMTDRESVIQDCTQIRQALSNTTELDAEIDSLNEELTVVAELVKACVRENTSTAQSQEEYAKRYNGLLARYEKARARLDVLMAEKERKLNQDREIRLFIETLKKQPLVLGEWDERLWIAILDRATVFRDGRIVFRFKSGNEVEVER